MATHPGCVCDSLRALVRKSCHSSPLAETKNESKKQLSRSSFQICRHGCNEQPRLPLESNPGLHSASHLIELHNVGDVLLLVNLLLSLEQRALAMGTAADPVIILLIQDGAHTAHTADAAPAGAMDTVG